MENYINKYGTPAEYAAGVSSRPADAPSISAVGPDSAFDGINVVAPMIARRVGDHVFFDKAAGRKVVIRGGTLRPAKLDSSRYVNLRNIFLGRVAGKNIFLDYTQTASKRYATGDEWTVSGFDFTQAGSAQLLFKYYGAAAADGQKSVTLTWEAGDTIESLIAVINATTGLKSYCTAVKVDATTMGVTINGYSASIGITVSSGDVTATRTYKGYQYTQYTDDPRVVYGITTIVRHNGDDTAGSAFVCFDRMYDYYYANGVQTTETLDGGIVRYSAFNTTTNPDLYAMFGGDYVAYMRAKYDQFRPEYPCNRLAISSLAIGDGCTAALAAVSHTDFFGATVNDFPNAVDAVGVGVTVDGFETGFEPGTGHLGGVAEAALLFKQIRRGKDDAINVSLKEGSGNTVNYDSYIRLAFPSGAKCAWFFHGYGFVDGNGTRYDTLAARVFRAFSDSEL